MTLTAEQYLLDGEAHQDGFAAHRFDGDLNAVARLRLPVSDADSWPGSDHLRDGLEFAALVQARREHRRQRLLSFEIAARTMELVRQARAVTTSHRAA